MIEFAIETLFLFHIQIFFSFLALLGLLFPVFGRMTVELAVEIDQLRANLLKLG